MPKVRRQNLPRALFAHLLERINQRQIPLGQLGLLNTWLDGEPEVPAGKWFKTFLRPGQVPDGTEIQ